MAIGLLLTASGCASVHMRGGMTAIGRPVEADGFAAVRRSPLSAAAHYDTAIGFLSAPTTTRGDMEMALSGFRTAARLAPDLWEPLAGAALVSDQMGNASEAMNLMAQAIERRGEAGSLALPFALLAYRAGEPELARISLAQAGPSGDPIGRQFLEAAFAGTGWHPQQTQHGIADSTGVNISPDDGRGIIIEAYIIRETRQANSNSGLNLLDGLSVQFGGTLLNYNYDFSGNTVSSQTGNVTITAPAINYSLNLVASSGTNLKLEASPLVLAREGHKSKFLEGGSVLIVPLSDHTQPIERDVGVSLEVTPQHIGSADVDLDVVLEMSNITGQSIVDAGRGAGLLQTDKTHVEFSSKVPYGKAIVVGSADSLSRRATNNRSLSRVALPGLSRRDQSAGSRDALVVLSVRPPEGYDAGLRSADAWCRLLFGVPLPPPSSYGRRPSDTPAPQLSHTLPTRLN